MNNKISIITGWGRKLGTGHVQRMAMLYHYLSSCDDLNVIMCVSDFPDDLTGSRSIFRKPEPDPDSSLIIRDMRDSDAQTIDRLRTIAPVLVIDDIGPGRSRADRILDLLPNPGAGTANPAYKSKYYLYGYNFFASLRAIKEKTVNKDIDIVFYAGSEATRDDVSFFVNLVPEKCRAVILTKDGPVYCGFADAEKGRTGFAALLMRTKLYVSHFGISLYEAKTAGCSLAAVNPTEYHSLLTEMVSSDLGVVNLGVRGHVNTGSAGKVIEELIKNAAPSAEPGTALDEVERKASACASYVQSLLAVS